MSIQAFQHLYFKRWGIETKFDELKNKLQIQQFTGDTPTSVEQDFYASLFLSNMAALIKQEIDEILAKNQEHKHLKHQYTVNMNILIGKLKDKLILILLETNLQLRITLFQKLIKQTIRNKSPKRPNRKFERRKSLNANRNGWNQKSCI